MLNDPLVLILMYFILPLWLLAGFADWLCHRASHIESTSGPKESMLHLLQFGEVGIALLAALFLDINAGIIAFMIVMFLVHEATALWDVSYAVTARRVTPVEQHIHSFLEMIPLIAIICVVALHWGQFQALFGFGVESAEFGLAWKTEPLPVIYVLALMAFIVVLAVVPYVEELVRGLRANGGASAPPLAGSIPPGPPPARSPRGD
ncbi:diguanylate cyclase [Pollutimonas bauzanensis]|uniref:Diguanylate cyclase n=1 Tax=Pollutimonas bauzanensis TaxID=658167 RepID=A0A1M5V824_9BURK|nr:diguanylate cyclase [Pollutimonas bauzanensis]SHH71083.1 hypothetical protein SAMN04488135_104269 [Pollutimonas bauzanensis]